MTLHSITRSRIRLACILLAATVSTCPSAYAALHVTLRNGSDFLCSRQELAGNRVRLYLYPSAPAASDNANYIEISASSVLSVETVPDPPAPISAATPAPVAPALAASTAPLTPAQLHQMLTRASTLHNVDADLLASVVKAESNGNAHAVSRAGAKGLMQLMPATASDLGVQNSFAPDQNITGGSAYLDQLLTRYSDSRGNCMERCMELALSAYNAGPAAVDRYHGIPPYAETRAYVARVIREFNRRKLAATQSLAAATH